MLYEENSMPRKSLMNQEIEKYSAEGYKLFKRGSGTISMRKSAKLAQAWDDCQNAHKRAEVMYAVGARAGQRMTEGYEWAVLYKQPKRVVKPVVKTKKDHMAEWASIEKSEKAFATHNKSVDEAYWETH